METIEELFKSKIQRLSVNDIPVILLSVGIIIAPVFIDPSISSKGWELPKVWFWQIYSLVLIAIILCIAIYRKTKFNSTFQLSKFQLLLFPILIFTLSVGSFLSDNFRILHFNLTENPLYKFLLQVVGETELVEIRTAIFGNEYREQGVITFLLIFCTLWILKSYVNSRNIIYIQYAYILSGLIQVFIAMTQLSNLVGLDLNTISESNRVYGTFGQPNFFAGHLLLGLIFALTFALKKYGRWQAVWYVITIILLFGILISFSLWALICAAFAIVLIAFNRFVKGEIGRIAIPATFILVTAAIFTLTILSPKIAEDKSIRFTIIENTYKASVKFPIRNGEYGRLLFGSGLDTLGDTLVEIPYTDTIYADRAHNIFFDVLYTWGLVGFSLFIILIRTVLSRFYNNPTNSVTSAITIAFMILIIRSMVHTNSIVNVMDLGIIIMILYSLDPEDTIA